MSIQNLIWGRIDEVILMKESVDYGDKEDEIEKLKWIELIILTWDVHRYLYCIPTNILCL